jgi:hypothetical protein
LTIFSTPGRQLVALGELLLLLLEHPVEGLAQLGERLLHALELGRGVLVGEADVEPVVARQPLEVLGSDLRALGELLRPAVRRLADQQLADPRELVVLDDPQLVVEVEAIGLQVGVDDLLRPLVALDPLAGEHLDVDDRPRDPRRDTQRRVLHVGGLLAEDRAQQLLLRGELGLALRRHLADEHVPRLDFGPDVDDPGLVEPAELRLAQRRDVAGDLLRS